MKLKKLLRNLSVQVKGSKEIEITGISSDSRVTAPGNLFIAKRGKTYDGTKFIAQALQNGARAIVTDIYDPFLEVVQVISKDIDALEAKIASRYFENPSKDLYMVGVTGTNGKSSVSYLTRHLLLSKNMPTSLIGTIEYIIGNNSIPAVRTTPDVITNHKLLREMLIENQKAAVLECTSHALCQNRLDEIDFDVALFTNLTPDHLDYHGTMDAYFAAKQKLFQKLKKKALAIVNFDDPRSQELIKSIERPVLTYGLEGGDVQGTLLEISLEGMRFSVRAFDQECIYMTSLIGKFNISNLLAVIALGLNLGYSLEEMKESIKTFKGISGRLERVPGIKKVFVDFAHTQDALESTLSTLRPLAKHRLITVFGCGGDRDFTKRPLMARVSEKYSDYSIVTSDNPRSEDPHDICRQIIKGFEKLDFFVEPDREKAIQMAIEMAGEKDVVLIAGKGHEKTQIFSHQTINFDDVHIAMKSRQLKV